MLFFCRVAIFLCLLLPFLTSGQVVDDISSTDEDIPVTFSVTDNDINVDLPTVDLDPSTPGRETVMAAAEGSFSVDDAGNVTFTPVPDISGSSSIAYTALDLIGNDAGTANISVTIIPVNDFPVAVDDFATTDENTAVLFDITANDTDIDGTIDGASIDLDPGAGGIQPSVTTSQGTFEADASGEVTFTPALSFSGTASIDYVVQDDLGAFSGQATFQVTVNNTDLPPVAGDDTGITTNENQPAIIEVLNNDSDDNGIDVATVDLDPGTGGLQNSLSTGGGDFTTAPSGIVTFTPATDYVGAANATYTVNDNNGQTSNTALISLTVLALNDPPVAVDDAGTTPENTPVGVIVTDNDTDPDGSIDPGTVDLDPASAGIQNTFTATNGDFSVDATGLVTFAPSLGFSGSESVDYTVMDNSGAVSNVATLTITVNNVNESPVAVNDSGGTDEDVSVNIGLVSNDTDGDGTIEPSTVDLDPSLAGIQNSLTNAQGSFSVNASGLLTFAPAANFNGPASITYTVQDNEGATSNVATVSITVNSVNDLPVAADDAEVTSENIPVDIEVLVNDNDVDGTLDASSVDLDPATAGIQNSFNTAGGSYSVGASGVVTFTPALNFNGMSSITYTVRDNSGGTSNAATITVTVNAVNGAPNAVNDAVTVDEDEGTTINVLANDTDDVGLAAATVDLDPTAGGRQTSIDVSSGNYSVNNAGVVTFTPVANFNGTGTIQYTVEDTEGTVSNAATITVNVNDVNDLPVANADAAVTNEDTPASISVLVNDSDVDGTLNGASVDLDIATAGIQSTITVTGGTYTVNGSGVVLFTPAANFNGTSSTQYNVRDDDGGVSNNAAITVTVNAVNDVPVAVNDAAATPEGNPVTVNVVANDTDDGTINAATVDLDPSTAGIQTSFSNASGSFTVNASGVVTYTPAVNFNGDAIITYTVNDNNGATSNAATITISVSGVNSPPLAADDAVTTNEDQAVSFNVLTNDSDDVSLAAATVDIDPGTPGRQTTLSLSSGAVSVNNSGVVSFTPVANFNGTVAVQYTVQDGEGAESNTATLTLTVSDINDLPVAVADAMTTNEDAPVSLNVTSNDTDVDGTIDASTVDLDVTTAGTQNTVVVTGGTFSVAASGVVTFAPAANFSGSASLQYNVRDDDGGISNNATITVTVSAVNDPPVAVNDAASTNESQGVSISVVANDTDDTMINAATVDLDPSAAGIQSTLDVAAGSFVVNSSGVVTFSPVANFNGPVIISYTVNDTGGLTSNVATITINVNSVNSAPVATNDSGITNEDTSVSFDITGNDTDDVAVNDATVDLNTAVAGQQTTRNTAQGNYSVDNNGNLTFTPALNFTGNASITYTVMDGEGATSNAATISITVNPVNDKPVAVNDTRTTNEDTPATINVVSNDSDVDGTISVSTVDLDPAVPGIQTSKDSPEGTFSVNAAGVVTFVPVNNFFGVSTISYVISDDQGLISDPATITVTVTAVNDAPIANNDITSTDQGVQISFNLVANDIDVDGSVNAATVDLNPSSSGIQTTRTVPSGTYTVNASGVVTFVPVANFSGTSSITYTVNDNAGAVSNAATISVLVNFVNQKPVANNDALTTTEDTPVSLNILANDTDDGSLIATTIDLNLTVSGFQTSISTAEGAYAVSNTGVLTFTPVLNFAGTSSISYTVNDNIGETSNEATITVTVTGVNDAPTATNDAASTNEDTNVLINVLSNDTDSDGTIDPASVDLIPGTDAIDQTRTIAQGTFTTNPANGVVTFTPTANFNGTASTTYNVRDNSGAKSNTATISVTILNVNDPPTFSVIENQRVLKNSAQRTVTITGISPGPSETEQLLLTATSQNTTLIPHPTITYSGTGATATLTFKPQLNQAGAAEVSVKAVDGGLNEFSRTFVITVVDVDITSVPVTLAIPGEAYEYNITTTDIPETLTLVTTQKPAWATLTSTAKNAARLSGTPPANATASPVTIQLRDGATVIDQQQFVIEINRRPVASPFELQGEEDSPLVIGADPFVLAYADEDGHPLTEVEITQLPKHGSLSLGGVAVTAGQAIPMASLNALSYIPLEEYSGPDTARYKVKDTYSLSLLDSYINFVISPVNDPPVIDVIEPDALVYDIGRELAQIFTTQFSAYEPEGDLIVSAVIGFRTPNFNPLHDLLEFNNTSSITGSYDEDIGVLTLTGAASVEDYESAIRSITYTFIDLDEIILDPRNLYIILSDGVSDSQPAERQIRLIYDFVDLQIPNIFTPDGNGKNDLWRISAATGLQQYNDAIIRVFDKRGNIIHETIGFDNPWDGSVSGTQVPEGTYFFAIDLKYGNERYTGSVTVLRNKQ